MRCDTRLLNATADQFVQQVRSSISNHFELAIKPTCLMKVVEDGLVLISLAYKSRNFLLCSVFYLGNNHEFFEAFVESLKRASEEPGCRVVRPAILRYMSSSGFKNYLSWDAPMFVYSKDLQHGLFNKSVHRSVFKEL
jgi:hypothetical protein